MTALTVTKKQGAALTEEQVVTLIKEGRKGKSLRAYAEELEVSPTYLADIFSGRRSPGEGMLVKFGIHKSTRTIVEYWK